ncbi:MAG: hypothetical protein IKC24_00630 [Oscillospiraceae bacterium]|nr:hypothetical protein [Oscillospiraceae bacterium]MBR6677923.1 hypothetical protein [Oscillospiraceae bacterium]
METPPFLICCKVQWLYNVNYLTGISPKSQENFYVKKQIFLKKSGREAKAGAGFEKIYGKKEGSGV